MNQTYGGKKILITGGTGSFGHTVARKLLDTEIDQIRIFSRDVADAAAFARGTRNHEH